MVEFVEVADLAVGALCVYGVLEGVENFLEGEGGVGLAIGHFPDVAVCTRTDLFGEVVACEDVGFNLFCHFYISGFKFLSISPSISMPIIGTDHMEAGQNSKTDDRLLSGKRG